MLSNGYTQARYEREKAKPKQMTLFNFHNGVNEDNVNYEKILKECIVQCKIKN